MAQSEQFNDKHLLWWVLKAINAYQTEGVRPNTLLDEILWENLGAPDWVLPAMREKYEQHGSPFSDVLMERFDAKNRD